MKMINIYNAISQMAYCGLALSNRICKRSELYRTMVLLGVLVSAPDVSAQTFNAPDTINWTQLADDLPTMYINVKNNQDINTQTKTETYYRAKIVVVDTNGKILVLNDSTGIRGRGNSTWNSAKKPYRLKFDKKKKLLGDYYSNNKSWTLLANAADKTMIRNALSRDLEMRVCGDVGTAGSMPFYPAAQFVDLVLNGQYRGVYQISDQVQVAKGRVNIDEDKGWFWEMAAWNAKEEPLVQVSGGGAFNIKNPEYDNTKGDSIAKTDSLKAVMLTYLQNEYNGMCAWGVNHTNGKDGWMGYFDFNTFVNWYVATELLGNIDAYTSIYIYKDVTDKKMKMGPIWDEDLAYNNCPTSGDMENHLTMDYQHNSEMMTPQVKLMWRDIRFADAVNTRFKELVDGGIQDYLLKKVDSLKTVINEAQKRNYSLSTTLGNAWIYNNYDVFDWTGYTLHDNYDDYITEIKNYIPARITYLTTRFDTLLQTVKDNEIAALSFDAKGTANDLSNVYNNANDTYGYYTNLNHLCGSATLTNRTISGASWFTFCAPFDASYEQAKAVFGCDFRIREFVGTNGTTMLFAEPEDKAIVGGYPYLIHLDDASVKKENPIFTNVMLTAKTAKTVTYNGYSYTGLLYTKTDMKTDGTELFLGTDNNLYKPASGKTTMYGMRAYFTVPSGTSAKISISDYDETTSINNVTYTPETVSDNKVYNLNGQCVGTSSDGLDKGVYIQNGNKFVIR